MTSIRIFGRLAAAVAVISLVATLTLKRRTDLEWDT